jgi:pyruvate, orthophosphate dikinase
MGIPHELFEEKLEAMKVTKGLRNDTELNVKDLEDLVAEYKDVYVVTKGEQFPSGMRMRIATSITKY